MKYNLPEDFTISFERLDPSTFQLKTSQTIPCLLDKTFGFFQDPCNLSKITPDWLDFKMKECKEVDVYEGAEFEYYIRVFGIRMTWRSKILDYKPPFRFVDIQLIGPYCYWSHLHTFEGIGEATLMKDIVTYRPPLYAVPFHFIIKRQLIDIFSYRSLRIKQWAKGELN